MDRGEQFSCIYIYISSSVCFLIIVLGREHDPSLRLWGEKDFFVVFCGRLHGCTPVDVLAVSVFLARYEGGGKHEVLVSAGTAYKLHCLCGRDGAHRCGGTSGGNVHHDTSITRVFVHPLTVSFPSRF